MISTILSCSPLEDSYHSSNKSIANKIDIVSLDMELDVKSWKHHNSIINTGANVSSLTSQHRTLYCTSGFSFNWGCVLYHTGKSMLMTVNNLIGDFIFKSFFIQAEKDSRGSAIWRVQQDAEKTIIFASSLQNHKLTFNPQDCRVVYTMLTDYLSTEFSLTVGIIA